MSKAGMRKKKRARNQAESDPFALLKTPRKQPNGRTRRPDEDAATEALQARCRHAGLQATADAIRDKRAPWWGCHAGRAISHLPQDQRLDLWGAVQRIRSVHAAYYRAMGVPSPHAKSLGILAPTPALQADATTPPTDRRDDETKAAHAKAAMSKLSASLTPQDLSLCRRIAVEDTPCREAARFIAALRIVAAS